MGDRNRVPGYYWLYGSAVWGVAKWDGALWYLAGQDEVWTEEDLNAEIDDRMVVRDER